MSRFFSPPQNVRGNYIYIEGHEARHILNVMRMKEKDKVVVFDGTGKEYTGFISKIKGKSLIIEVVSTRYPKKSVQPEITLFQCMPKKEKMDYIVEKATELGVHSIKPLISERTIARPSEEKNDSRISRWEKIALNAAKQCGRNDIPEIRNIEKFYNALDSVNDFDLVLMAHLSEGTIPLREAIKDFDTGRIAVFIGPEGDFTAEEIIMAKETNCKLISLGPRVLKSDTAGLYVITILNYEFFKQ